MLRKLSFRQSGLVKKEFLHLFIRPDSCCTTVKELLMYDVFGVLQGAGIQRLLYTGIQGYCLLVYKDITDGSNAHCTGQVLPTSVTVSRTSEYCTLQ